MSTSTPRPEFVLPEGDWPATLPLAHRAQLRGLLNELRRDPDLVGVAAGGSFISGRMDEFSDLDLVVAVRSDAWPAVLERRREIAARAGSLLAAFTGEHVGEPRLLICLYGPPLVHVDLKFVTLDTLAMRVEDPVVLWDRLGALPRAMADGKATYPTPDLQWIEDRFWVWVHYAATKLGRGETLELLDFLSFLRGRVLGPLALQAAGAQPNGVRRLEELAPGFAAGLRTTVAEPHRKDGLRALQQAVALYQKLREESGLPLGRRAAAEAEAIEYVRQLEARVSRDGET